MRDRTRRGTEKHKRDEERHREEKERERKRKEHSLTSLRQDGGSQEAEKGDLLSPGAAILQDRLRMGTELPKPDSLLLAVLRRVCWATFSPNVVASRWQDGKKSLQRICCSPGTYSLGLHHEIRFSVGLCCK